MRNATRYVIAYTLAAAAIFFAGIGVIALCQRAALGETATMLVTVPLAAGAGVLVLWLLMPQSN